MAFSSPSPAQPMAAQFLVTPRWSADSTFLPLLQIPLLCTCSNTQTWLPSSRVTVYLWSQSQTLGGTKLMSSSCHKTGSPWINSPFWSNQLRRDQPQCLHTPWAPTQGREWVSRPPPPLGSATCAAGQLLLSLWYCSHNWT